MRILGVGEYADLGDVYLRLAAEGHTVKLFSSIRGCRDILSGLIERVVDWRAELDWVRTAGRDGIVIFETANDGATQDKLRTAGYRVIGGSGFGDRLENDRSFGQDVLRELGLAIAPMQDFTSFDTAIDFLRERGGRYVFKANGSVMGLPTYVGQAEDGADLVGQLIRYRARWTKKAAPRFVLMKHLRGIEVGVGAYFNGREFLDPPCIDWEHKRFFPGDLGEMTGEMGTIVSYRGAAKLMDETLRKLAPRLRADGYCGYINLNTIVNDAGIWPLEFTARFGYPGSAILGALQMTNWSTLFQGLLDRSLSSLATRSGFAAGVVLTVPPFPYRTGYAQLSKGLPVFFRGDLTPNEIDHLHYWEVARDGGQLVTAGILGQVMVVTALGPDIHAAQTEAYRLADRVIVPNLRYRTDIGDKLAANDLAQLCRLGLFSLDDFSAEHNRGAATLA
ncbi:MAG TPA: phosphoribosylglycinamide synthetase C domain-containing protein [Candidatus Binataceae bacterium]|nr:phosphoribosylglycinamide synthetase C domain-containing protein [Candidatus Binataceae bacterium]